MPGSSKGIRAGRAFVEIFADTSQLRRAFKGAQQQIRAFSASVGSAGASLLRISGALAAPFALATRTFISFEDQLAIVRSVTQATEKDFEALTETAKELGRTTSFSATQVAEGMTELGRAGFDAQQIIATIPNVLNLARATATELGRAAEISAAAIRGFGLDVRDSAKVADVLSLTANKSATTLDLLGESFRDVAPIAKTAGESIEDTSAILGVLANAQIKGSQAGVALRNAFLQIADPQIQKRLKELYGIQVTDGEGNLRKLSDVLEEVGAATSGLGTGEQIAIFKELFGKRTIAAAGAAAGNIAGFKKLRKELGEGAGAAQTFAEAVDKTLGGSFRKLFSAVEGTAIQLAEVVGPTIKELADIFREFAGQITKLIKNNASLVKSFFKAVLVVGAVGAALVGIAGTAAALGVAIGALSSVLGGILGAFALFKTVLLAILSPVGLLVAGLTALGVAFVSLSGTVGASIDTLSNGFRSLYESLSEAIGLMVDALINGDIEGASKSLWAEVNVIWIKGTNFLSSLWGQLVIDIQNATDALGSFLVSAWDGFATSATNAFDTVLQVVLKAGRFIQNTFFEAIKGVTDGFASLAQTILQGGYELRLLDDNQFIKGSNFIENLRKGSEAFAEAQQGLGDRVFSDTIEESKERQRKRDEDNARLNAGLADAQSRNAEKRNEKFLADLAKAEGELSKAQQDAATAREELQKKAAQRAANEAGKTAEGAGGTIGDAIKAAFSGLESGVAAGREATVAGGFSAAAFAGFSSIAADDKKKIALAQQTANNTKRIADNATAAGSITTK